jgi:hypothetical protein
MELADDLAGTLARLPNDELVEIEEVYPDGKARVRRIEGERQGTIAICDVSELNDA